MKKTIILLFLLLLGVVLSSPNLVLPRAHAATGEVCLADPSTATGSTNPCPLSPIRFDGPIGQQVRAGVFIQGSDSLNGFDVTLRANNTYFRPVGADLTGTVLPGTPTIIVECLQGVLIRGSVCAPTDNVTTLHFVVTGGLGLLTTLPTTGLLFNAVYSVNSTTPASGVPVTYQGPYKGQPNGCGSSTSVSGGICVTVSNGSTTALTETAQG